MERHRLGRQGAVRSKLFVLIPCLAAVAGFWTLERVAGL